MPYKDTYTHHKISYICEIYTFLMNQSMDLKWRGSCGVGG